MYAQPFLKLPAIGETKFLLIIGVVLIHCNVCNDIVNNADVSLFGFRAVNFVSTVICSCCVPDFYAISAILFFNGISKFTFPVYLSKLKRRVKTLLIPYIFWCTLCALFLYIKHKYFHMSGLGIFPDDGGVNWVIFFKGYIYISEANFMPYAFAFWFIRNLMVFVVLSPVAWVIGRNWLLTVLLFICSVIFDINLFGFEWFVVGTFLIHNRFILKTISHKGIIIASVVFWLSAYIISCNNLYNHLSPLLVLSGLYLVYSAGLLLKRLNNNHFVRTLISSTFMIYAVHQCFCTKVRLFWLQVLGTTTSADIIISYIASFVTLLGASVIVYIITKRISPRFLSIITGGR